MPFTVMLLREEKTHKGTHQRPNMRWSRRTIVHDLDSPRCAAHRQRQAGHRRKDMDKERMIQSFCVQATPAQPRYDVSDSLPSHHFVLWPILTTAAEARVIGRVRDHEIKAVLASIARPTRGGFELDLSKDVLRGSERLWNARAWARGAIVLACPP